MTFNNRNYGLCTTQGSENGGSVQNKNKPNLKRLASEAILFA